MKAKYIPKVGNKVIVIKEYAGECIGETAILTGKSTIFGDYWWAKCEKHHPDPLLIEFKPYPEANSERKKL